MARLSRESIAAEAVAIADEDGLEAVSMRRVAQRLGVGTMSLYHYVATKHELLSLMGDAIMAAMVIPAGEVPDGWRNGLAEIARRTKAIFDRHPWVASGWGSERGDPGPSLLHHIEQTLAVMAELDFLSPGERVALSGLVDEYVIGHIFRAPAIDGEADSVWAAFIAEHAVADEFPLLAALYAEGEPAEPPDAFERGLAIVLDGIALEIDRHRAGGA